MLASLSVAESGFQSSVESNQAVTLVLLRFKIGWVVSLVRNWFGFVFVLHSIENGATQLRYNEVKQETY